MRFQNQVGAQHEPTLQVRSNMHKIQVHVKLKPSTNIGFHMICSFLSLDSISIAHLPRVDRPSSCRKSHKHCEVAAHSLVTWGKGIGKQKEKRVERATSRTSTENGTEVWQTVSATVRNSNAEQSPSFSLSFFQSIRSTCSGLKASRIASDRK